MSSFQNVKVNYAELKKLKSKKDFSKRGEYLLDIKRKRLLGTLNQSLKDFFKEHSQFRRDFKRKRKTIKLLYQTNKVSNLKVISHLHQKIYNPNVEIKFINEVGIQIPKVSLSIEKTTHKLPIYSFFNTSVYLDKYIREMKGFLQQIINLALKEDMIYKISQEYVKVNRRINALDEYIIPKLDMQIDKITEVLEDNEREEMIQMKKLKTQLETQSD